MRSYLIDEISRPQMERIRGFLQRKAVRSRLEDVFWVEFPEGLLEEAQAGHVTCRPHVFAVELGPDWVKFELLVRSLKVAHCPCHSYCTPRQREYVLGLAHEMITDLEIAT